MSTNNTHLFLRNNTNLASWSGRTINSTTIDTRTAIKYNAGYLWCYQLVPKEEGSGTRDKREVQLFYSSCNNIPHQAYIRTECLQPLSFSCFCTGHISSYTALGVSWFVIFNHRKTQGSLPKQVCYVWFKVSISS